MEFLKAVGLAHLKVYELEIHEEVMLANWKDQLKVA